MRRLWWIFTLLAAACGPVLAIETVPTPTPALPQAQIAGTPLPGNLDTVTFIEDNQQYSIHQLLPRDGIRPFYEPQFADAAASPYRDNDLVMGLEINGDARAYSVGILTRREMVNDVVGGTPVLVTW